MMVMMMMMAILKRTRQSKQCKFCIYILDENIIGQCFGRHGGPYGQGGQGGQGDLGGPCDDVDDGGVIFFQSPFLNALLVEDSRPFSNFTVPILTIFTQVFPCVTLTKRFNWIWDSRGIV